MWRDGEDKNKNKDEGGEITDGMSRQGGFPFLREKGSK